MSRSKQEFRTRGIALLVGNVMATSYALIPINNAWTSVAYLRPRRVLDAPAGHNTFAVGLTK